MPYTVPSFADMRSEIRKYWRELEPKIEPKVVRIINSRGYKEELADMISPEVKRYIHEDEVRKIVFSKNFLRDLKELLLKKDDKDFFKRLKKKLKEVL